MPLSGDKIMIYQSTRGHEKKVSALTAIREGIAPDGGLYIPLEIPSVSKEAFEKMKDMSYPERAAFVLSLFIDELSYETLLSECEKAYSSFTGGIAPVKFLDGTRSVLELWHGPTCAFKDMALQIMPRLLSKALEASDEKRDALILTATSGDTGKAALEGYKDANRIKIMVFYPENGVSDIQKLQMRTQEGDNLSVCAIRGNFDDAQSGVKRIFADKEIAEKLSDKGYFLTSANSINWGRLAPQIAYYFSLCCDILKERKTDAPIDICVPTGNFGNILAAYYAKRMGAPIGKLICASNSNDVLTVFINTGVYDRNREFYTTLSPSMDILLSSNLERLLAILSSREECASYMKSLAEHGRYEVSDALKASIKESFVGICCDEENCKKTVKSIFDRYSYLIDTHTAVAAFCADEYIGTLSEYDRQMAIVSTAAAFKFAPAVCSSLGINTSESDSAEKLSDFTKAEIPYPIASLKSKTPRFSQVIDKEDMADAVLLFADKQ